MARLSYAMKIFFVSLVVAESTPDRCENNEGGVECLASGVDGMHDEAALLQTASKLDTHASSKAASKISSASNISSARLNASESPSSCTCLPWGSVYTTTQCGTGYEFAFANSGNPPTDVATFTALASTLYSEFCANFYTQLPSNACVNMNMGADMGQWCYVSASCANLNGGRVVNSHVNSKVCTAGQDTMLRDSSPPELSQFSIANNLDMGLLHKMSYPLYQTALWGQVEAVWGMGNGSIGAIPAAILSDMSAIQTSGAPNSFDSAPDNHPPHRIVVGQTVYGVDPNPDADINHPGSWQVFSCLSHCS